MKTKSFKCGYCTASRTTKRRLREHIKRVHKSAPYLELTAEGQDEAHPFLGAAATQGALRQYRRQVLGESAKEGQKQSVPRPQQAAQKKAPNSSAAGRRPKVAAASAAATTVDHKVLEAKADNLKAHLGVFCYGWIDLKDLPRQRQQRGRRTLRKVKGGGLQVLASRRPRHIFADLTTMTVRQLQLLDKAEAAAIDQYWARHVRHTMGRIRLRCETVFEAAAMGWFGDAKQAAALESAVNRRLDRPKRNTK